MVKVMSTAPAIGNQIAEATFVYCGEGYLFDNCLRNPTLVNYVGNFTKLNQGNSYSNTYNPRWR